MINKSQPKPNITVTLQLLRSVHHKTSIMR